MYVAVVFLKDPPHTDQKASLKMISEIYFTSSVTPSY